MRPAACDHHRYRGIIDCADNLNTHADGTVWADTVYEYKYDNSDKVWRRMYSFGALTRETFYNEDGGTVKEVEYLEEGAKQKLEISELKREIFRLQNKK